MTREQKIWLGIGIAFVLLAGVGTEEAVRNYYSKYKEDDVNLLLPTFRQRVLALLVRMRNRGFDPIVFDTKRTAAEAAANAAKGTGIVNSLHLTGAASDIISGSKGWSDPAFFEALGEEAKKLWLTWGGTFSKYDPSHVQAIPVSLQNAYRALNTDAARDAFIEKYYETIGVA
jgi:hypothetical protein